MNEDERYLSLLAIFHYIVGGLTALFACFPFIHVAVGLAMVFGKLDGKNPPPPCFGWFFVIVGGTVILCGWALAVAILVAGRKLQRRRSWMYCMVVGGLECMIMPFGTVLGVFTIIVLMKDAVKKLFAAG
jgi:hypothetical protein